MTAKKCLLHPPLKRGVLEFRKFTFAFSWNLFSCFLWGLFGLILVPLFVFLIQMPFILPLNYTKCSIGRADVLQLYRKINWKGNKSWEGVLDARSLLQGRSVRLCESRQRQAACPSSSQAIKEAISPPKAQLHKPRGAQGHSGRQEPKLRTQRKGHPVWALPKAAPGEPQPQCPGLNPIKMSQCQSTFGAEGVYCWGAWDTWWGAWQEHLGIAQDFLWDVRGGTKGR